MKILNKIKNKVATLSREVRILKLIKDSSIELSVKLKKETPLQRTNRIELLNSIKKLNNKNIECTNTWDMFRQGLRSYILKHDVRNFLRWDPVVVTMFAGTRKFELDYLMANNWDKWSKVIEETWVGNPPKYRHYKKSSSNLIHITFNLAQLIDYYKLDVRKFNKITEFGGGYGCMAKLINNLGFTGKYSFFDTPEFLALQKYYLGCTSTKGNFHFTDQIENLTDPNPDLFIATWSLSESPLELRETFLKKIGQPQYILIGYQGKFETIDNVRYFEEFRKNRPEYDWVHYEIEHPPGNYYLIGKKK